MTDIIISYEDGLRLSELYGQLQGYEYELAHMLGTHALEITLMGFVGILVGIFACAYFCDNIRSDKLSTIFGMACFIGVPILFVLLGCAIANGLGPIYIE